MTSDTDLERAASWRARDRISYAVHGLPAGVVDGPDGAAPTACREMMEGLEEFERLRTRLGLDDHINLHRGVPLAFRALSALPRQACSPRRLRRRHAGSKGRCEWRIRPRRHDGCTVPTEQPVLQEEPRPSRLSAASSPAAPCPCKAASDGTAGQVSRPAEPANGRSPDVDLRAAVVRREGRLDIVPAGRRGDSDAAARHHAKARRKDARALSKTPTAAAQQRLHRQAPTAVDPSLRPDALRTVGRSYLSRYSAYVTPELTLLTALDLGRSEDFRRMADQVAFLRLYAHPPSWATLLTRTRRSPPGSSDTSKTRKPGMANNNVVRSDTARGSLRLTA